MTKSLPPIFRGNINAWAAEVSTYLSEQSREDISEVVAAPVFLQHMRGGEKALVDGIVLFDPVLGAPVVSIGGAWVQITLTP